MRCFDAAEHVSGEDCCDHCSADAVVIKPLMLFGDRIPHLLSAFTELTLQALRKTGFLAILSLAPRLIVSAAEGF